MRKKKQTPLARKRRRLKQKRTLERELWERFDKMMMEEREPSADVPYRIGRPGKLEWEES